MGHLGYRSLRVCLSLVFLALSECVRISTLDDLLYFLDFVVDLELLVKNFLAFLRDLADKVIRVAVVLLSGCDIEIFLDFCIHLINLIR